MKKVFKKKIGLIALSLVLGIFSFSCSKRGNDSVISKENTENLKGKSINSKTMSSIERPLNLNLTLLGAKITATWINPSDLPNTSSVTTQINYSGLQNFTFYLTKGTATHSFSGVPGESYSVTVTITYPTMAGWKTVTETKDIAIPSTATPDPNSCTVPTAEMSFPEEIEYAGPNQETLYKQDNQIIVRLPADFVANQLWVIRYRKNEYGSTWQYTSTFPSSGTIINGRNFNISIINGLDGEYVFELGVSCSGVATNFTNTSYASTTVL